VSSAPAEDYGRYIGRYSEQLARQFPLTVGVREGQRVLDVGCGPGALTASLVELLGADHVSAVDPSPAYVAACGERSPGVDVRAGVAEGLPFADGAFDVTLSQLVVNLMEDAPAGVREMSRVTRPGGTVAALVWAHDGMPLLARYWEAATVVAPEAVAAMGETGKVGLSEAQLLALWRGVGLEDISSGRLTATAAYDDFDDLWSPIEAGVGRSGAVCQSLEPNLRRALRAEFHRRLGTPAGPFELTAVAWWVKGTVAG
jgi:SAM-dependent methyltransferase